MWMPAKTESEPPSAPALPIHVRLGGLAGLALAVFFADLSLPLRCGAGVLYLGVVLASLWGPRARDSWLVAGLCTLLALVRMAVPHADPIWSAAVARGLEILAI